jgi:hypothetical protein
MTCFNCSNPVDSETRFCPYCDVAIAGGDDLKLRPNNFSSRQISRQRLWPLTLVQLMFVVLGLLAFKFAIQVYQRFVVVPSVIQSLKADVMGVEHSKISMVLPWVALPVIIVVARSLSGAFYRIGRTKRQLKRDIKAALLLDRLRKGSQEPFSLYLRSFSEDTKLRRHKGVWWYVMSEGGILNIDRETLDLVISSEMRHSCPVIAFDQVRETLGAGRLLSADGEWESVVLFLMKRAQLIFVVPGTSKGVVWEVEQLRNYFKKTVFVMPPARYWRKPLKNVEQLWHEIRTEFSTRGILMPSYDRSGALFRLNEQGQLDQQESFESFFGNTRIHRFVFPMTDNPPTTFKRFTQFVVRRGESALKFNRAVGPLAIAMLVTFSFGSVLWQKGTLSTNESLGNEYQSIEPFPHVIEKYQQEGVSFSHPRSWTVQDERYAEGKVRIVTVESLNSGLYIFLVPFDSKMNLDSFALQVSATKQASMIGKVGERKTLFISRKAEGRLLHGIRHNFSVTLAGETISYSQDFFERTSDKMKVFITIVAPDTEWEQSDKSFTVILDSFRLG